ncbi:MAG TPA: hypothetical protein VFI90_04190 [Rubrobacter sp.]|nr:hypothetical protein [Rubrobacter sp.]
MALWARLRKLEQAAEEEIIAIPQQDGTLKRFPQSAGMDAYMNLMDRMVAGEDAPPEHLLIEAVKNSSDPTWAESFYAMNDEGWTDPIEDLSE